MRTYQLSTEDAIDWLKNIHDGSADLVITDPPYESLEKHRKVGTTTRLKQSKGSSNKWFDIFPNSRFPELFTECYRVLKNNSHMYMFCDQDTLFEAVPIAKAAGFRYWKFLVWDKQRIGMGYHYRARHELIMFLEKGKRKLNSLSTPDVLSFPRIIKGYPTEKPVELSKVLVEQSSSDGELVIDPFVGAGSVGVAALELDRRFWGNDNSREAIDLASARCRAASV